MSTPGTRIAQLSLLRHRLMVLHELYRETRSQLDLLELEMLEKGEINRKDI